MSKPNARRALLTHLDWWSGVLPEAWTGTPTNDLGETLAPTLHWLRKLRALVNPAGLPLHDVSLARSQFKADVLSLVASPPVQVGEVRELTIPGPSGGAMRCRHYRAADAQSLPVLVVYLHGGGFVLGDLDTHDDACRRLCLASGLQILSIDYRLAPEHPFPAAFDDAMAALRWAQHHASDFGVHPSAVAVAGDSAGGTLAAAIAQAAHVEGAAPLAQLLLYCGFDRGPTLASHRHFGQGYFLSAADRDWFYRYYLDGDESLALDPRVSPARYCEPGPLPPAVVVTCGFDMLRDEGIAYVEHRAQRGDEVVHLHQGSLGHAFLQLAGVSAISREAIHQSGQAFRQVCRSQLMSIGAHP
jgi:acetyl esterase